METGPVLLATPDDRLMVLRLYLFIMSLLNIMSCSSTVEEDRDDSALDSISCLPKWTGNRLPVHDHRDHILFLLQQHNCLVVQGETGSGKSTQIAQFLLDAGFTHSSDGHKTIAVTQPRKVAAVSLAARVAEERSSDLGSEVGYAVRFDEKWDPDRTRIKFMTEGILIREMHGDPLLQKYSVIIVDEAHERSVQTDVLLGCLKRLLGRRTDLKVIVSSATLEAETLSKFFRSGDRNAPILCVEGRSHPIEIYYLQEPVANYVKSGVEAVIAIHEAESIGDILFFLTGMDEIEEAVSLLLDYSKSLQSTPDQNVKKMFVLPLHASLPVREQFKVFDTFPRSVRKVIVATNVAEASVTIPGITYVVDCGFVKMRYFDPVFCSDALVVVPVSQASADQRAGRAGRTRSGKAYRLYPESEYLKLQPFITPEIERSSTAAVILQLKALGVRNLLDFSFPSPPPQVNVLVGLELLYALGAIDIDGELTDPIGLQMAEFPVQPMHSRCLLHSGSFECSEEIVTIISMLQVENIFQQPSSGQRVIQARRAKHRLSVEEGDLITYLNIYNEFLAVGRTRSWADKNFLNYNALLRVGEIRNRLVRLMKQFRIEMVTANGDTEAVRKCLVAGMFANSAYLSQIGERVYKTVRGDHELKIHPSSVLYTIRKSPQFLVYNDVVHTSEELMRDLLVVDKHWLHELAPQYFEYGTERQIREKRMDSVF